MNTTNNTTTPNTSADTSDVNATVSIPQHTAKNLSRFARKALIVVAVAGAVAGAYYFLSKTKVTIEVAGGETTDATPAAE